MGAMIRAGIRVDRRLADGLQALLGAPMAACSGCDDRNGGTGHSKKRVADRDGASWRGRSVGGDVQLAGRRVSGGREPSGWQGGLNCSSHGQRRGEMQSEAARRAGEPSGQGEEPPPEGLGGYQLLAQADARCPAGQVVGHHLHCQPGALRQAQDWRRSGPRGNDSTPRRT